MFNCVKEQRLWALLARLCMLLALCSSFTAPAQVFFSTNPNYLRVKTEQNNLTSTYRYAYPDTTVTQVSNFFPRNFMGNLGLPSPAYFLKYGTDDLGFRFFNAPTESDRILEKQVEYYRSTGPYANLTGIAGSKLLQIFKLGFTHTYKDKVNFTVKFNRYSSQGYYLKQQSYVNNFYLSSNYTSKNRRFGYYGFILNNGNKNQENGGIKDGTLNDSTVLLSKVLLPVRLTGATHDNRETKLMLNPWFRLNRAGDSLHGLDHYLQLKSRASQSVFKYRDPNIITDNYYQLLYLDTALTNDSANIRQLSNELSYTTLSRDSRFAFSAGYRNEVSSVWQKNAELLYNHLLVSDVVYRRPLQQADSLKARNLETSFNLQYVVSGVNAGNLKLENNSFLVFDAAQSNLFFLNVLFEKRNADRIYNDWTGNHFNWQSNGYGAQNQVQLKLGTRLGRAFTASVLYNSIKNYLYFDSLALPRQFKPIINNLGLSLEYNYVFFKHLGVGLNYIYQNTSHADYIRLPQNSGTAKLYYNGNLYKGNLQLQIGTQLQVYQGFTSYAYMPATQVFYLQDGFKTESYPYVDVYLNARIRPVSFFLKMENMLGKGAAGSNYALVPGYYQPERAFRFGLSWMFFD